MLAGAAVFKVPAGQWGALMLRFAGDAAAGVTIATTHYGNLTATHKGTGFMSVPIAQLHILNQHVGGVAEAASVAGAAFAHSVVILPSYVHDGNIFDVVETDEFYITVDLSGISAATIDNGTVTLLGHPQLGAQAYLPHVISQTANVPASGYFAYDIHHDNVGLVLIATLTNVDRMEIMRDRLMDVQCTTAEGLAQANFFGTLETARTDDILYNMVRSGMFDESLSDDITVKIYATAGGIAAPVITAICYDGTPDLLSRSKDSANAFMSETLSRKAAANKTRVVSVSQTLKGGGRAATK